MVDLGLEGGRVGRGLGGEFLQDLGVLVLLLTLGFVLLRVGRAGYLRILTLVVAVVVVLLDEIELPDERLAELEKDPLFRRLSSVLLQLLPHRVDGAADLERRAQLDLHVLHEVVGLQEHEGLAVDLLELEVLHVVRAAREVLEEVADLE